MPSKRDVRELAEKVHATAEELHQTVARVQKKVDVSRVAAAVRVRAEWARINRER